MDEKPLFLGSPFALPIISALRRCSSSVGYHPASHPSISIPIWLTWRILLCVRACFELPPRPSLHVPWKSDRFPFQLEFSVISSTPARARMSLKEAKRTLWPACWATAIHFLSLSLGSMQSFSRCLQVFRPASGDFLLLQEQQLTQRHGWEKRKYKKGKKVMNYWLFRYKTTNGGNSRLAKMADRLFNINSTRAHWSGRNLTRVFSFFFFFCSHQLHRLFKRLSDSKNVYRTLQLADFKWDCVMTRSDNWTRKDRLESLVKPREPSWWQRRRQPGCPRVHVLASISSTQRRRQWLVDRYERLQNWDDVDDDDVGRIFVSCCCQARELLSRPEMDWIEIRRDM